MTPKTKFRLANFFMLAGMAPFLLGLGWIRAVLVYAQHHKGQMGGSDAFLMMGVLLLTYILTLIVSGASALWSAILARRNAAIQARAARAIRWVVCIVLIAPVFWYLGVAFSLF
jgi:hypothetical protein